MQKNEEERRKTKKEEEEEGVTISPFGINRCHGINFIIVKTDFWAVNFQKNYRVNPEIPYELINFSGSLKSFFHSQ